ncbi:hypothetical protein D3C81_2239810 [compost metagenome]
MDQYREMAPVKVIRTYLAVCFAKVMAVTALPAPVAAGALHTAPSAETVTE